MNVAVVGGAGYIGGALTDKLQTVKVYDNLTFQEDYRKDIDFVFGDVRDHRKLKPLLEWADCVVWLAALVGDGACAINPELSKEINQDSVKWLADNFDGRIIFMSTCSVYGARDGLLTEDSPTNPLSVYAQTKLAAEKYLENKNAIIFRLGTLFGVGDRYSRIRLDLVLNTMTARAKFEGRLKVFGGDQWRPLLHVQDVAEAIYNQIDSDVTGIFNLHYKNMKIVDLGNIVSEITSADIETEDVKFEDARNYRVSSKKAKQELDFDPTYSVEDGVYELLELFNDGRIKDPNNLRYSNEGFLNANQG